MKKYLFFILCNIVLLMSAYASSSYVIDDDVHLPKEMRISNVVEMFDFYYSHNGYFIKDHMSRPYSSCVAGDLVYFGAKKGTREERTIKCLRSLDIFCSQELWYKYGKYTNVNQEDRECFCEYNSCYKEDKCILVRRKAGGKDIGFFNYKAYLPDGLEMSMDRFKQIADKYKVLKDLEASRCWDRNLELITAEREACAKHMKDYIEKLIYNKLPACKEWPSFDSRINCHETNRPWYQKKEECMLIEEVRFELDNNCVVKE